MMNPLDPLAHLNFAPTCDMPGCEEVAYRMHRPPCHCYVSLLCLPHTLKARLELEMLARPITHCPVCGRSHVVELLEHRIPAPKH